MSITIDKLKELFDLSKKELEQYGVIFKSDFTNKSAPYFICIYKNKKISFKVPRKYMGTEKDGIYYQEETKTPFLGIFLTPELLVKYKDMKKSFADEIIIFIMRNFKINSTICTDNTKYYSINNQIASNEIETQSQNKKSDVNNIEKVFKTNIPAQLLFSAQAYNKIINHANQNPKLECGGFLIGNLGQDQTTGAWVGLVEDIFSDNSVGKPSTYTFTPQMTLAALNHCKVHYRDDWDITKHIIGNYHSHGIHKAFFSDTDKKMMHTQSTNEFYLVISPSYKNICVLFMDSHFSLHNVKLNYFYEKHFIKNDFSLKNKK